MKHLTSHLVALFSLLSTTTVSASQVSLSSVPADTLISKDITRQKVVENGGGGIYRSIVVTDKSMTGYTIYRPRDVQWAAKHEGRLPLLVWANGACSDDNKGYENMLSDLASHGYVVIALGKMRMDDNDPSGGTSGSEHVAEAINWMVKQFSNTKSEYYHAVDVNKIALSGHSCGGAEAIANCGNSRVKTLLIMNAGMGGMSMGGASPQTLKSLHCPIIYLTGGTGDVAYENAKTDFGSITKVPVVWADLSTAGHGGTYWHHHGGDFERIALKWMDWHLKGKTQNAPVFLNPDYADFSGWKFQNKNFKAEDYEAAYRTGATVADTLFHHDAVAAHFALGADVSNTTKMEAAGQLYYNRQGKKADIMNILKDQGMNAVRFRVWVNPEESYSNKSDVQKLCTRAKRAGLDIMLDFHYSDFWANGGNQFKPRQWEGHTVDALVNDVYNHTFDVLNTLKKAGIKVRWAQIGNEVDNGMLWGDGRVGKANFLRFINSAYSAIKAVDPETQAVIHVGDGQNLSSLESFFDRLQNGEAQWDAIGLSAFPKWSGLKVDELIAKTVESVKGLQERYQRPVMIVESGHYNNRPLESNEFFAHFIDTLSQVGASGLFCWEPEVMKDYELGAWNPLTLKPSIALDAFLGLKHRSVPYLMKLSWDMPSDSICQSGDPLQIDVEATHIAGRISSLGLYNGRDLLATTDTLAPHFQVAELPKGINTLYVRATDTDGQTQTTDSCIFIQGPLTVADQTFKESPDGRDDAQYWSVRVTKPGQYMLVFKYQASDVLTPRVLLFDTRLSTLRFAATEPGKWGYVSKTITVDEPGTLLFSLHASSTKTVIPQVDTFCIIPLEDQPLPTVADPTAISSPEADAPGEATAYDLQGRRVTRTSKGIHILKSDDSAKKVSRN